MTSAERASVMLAVAQRIDHVCSWECRDVRELTDDELSNLLIVVIETIKAGPDTPECRLIRELRCL